ncbi:TonB-dependent receptor [Alkalisalibacterium limincola]|uniref:TonB-dependent receptor n=1 Tax=Alkalisalibacterium limincola TaxID=2699169 RepID=A0A5C8L1S6_9GAMM|nr:TonB-dependent receptor [Alkalisalibacterium limincola]TXK66023.1 TonB-dependent receptor [Alkalisalibacterium limincola]
MNSRPFAARPLALAIALVLPGTALADPPEQAVRLDTLIVTGTPLQQSAEDLARPWEVLTGAELERSKSVTLGETLDSIPGVHAGYFGPGVGRPIIRGLEGGRVQVLAGGMSALDVSTIGVDHATSIEPFLADQIEVLKGPGTLLYGSGALGGAVNVVDGRIPEQVPDADSGLTGRAELRGNTVNDERTGMVRLDGGGGNFAFNVNLLSRDTSDFKIPGEAERHHDDHDDDHGDDDHDDDHHDDHGHGRLENSALRTRAASFGASLIGERGFVGTAFSMFDTRFGLPGHFHDDHDDHGHGHGHGHDDHHDDDDDDHHDDHDGEEVYADLRQRRVDLKAGVYDPFAGHDSLTFRVSRADYTHTEFEDGHPETVFENEGLEARLEATHHEFAGWRGAWGLQYGRRDFNAFGDEAFVPASITRDLGVFVLEEKTFDRLKLELGGRVDRTRVKPEDTVSRGFTTGSASVAGRFKLTDDFHLLGGLDHVQRAPAAEELLSNGVHVATRSYELGDWNLGREKANRAELGFHWHGQRFDLTGAVYHTDFSDFIYLADTGVVEDDLPVRLWTQADTRFTGAEIEARFTLLENQAGRWQGRVFGDYVRASFKGDQSRTVDIAIPHGNHFHNHTVDLDLNGALPRIPAGRVGVGLDWDRDHWRAGVGAVHYTSQDRVAQFEDPSDSYTLVNANLAYHWDMRNMGWEVFLDGRNLTNTEARPHTSFLRDLAPLPGRSLAFGLRMHF